MKNAKSIVSKIDIRSAVPLLIIFVLAFVMLLLSPVRLDDWSWGGTIGILRLNRYFADDNGRYFSDLLVVILTRLPKWVCALVQTVILGAILFIFKKLIKGTYLFCLAVILLLLMPLEIFTQTITWVAGFSNYAVSVFFVLFVYELCINRILEDKSMKIRSICLICPVILISALILETSTLYIIFLLILTQVFYISLYKKVSPACFVFLLFAVIGAVIMFSNGGYSMALNGESPKAITISGTLSELCVSKWEEYRCNLATKWLGISRYLTAFIAFTLIPYSAFVTKKRRIADIVISIALFVLFFYDITEMAWRDSRRIGSSVYACAGIFLCLFLIYLFIRSAVSKLDKYVLLICILSQLALVSPLPFVYPVHERLFLQTYFHWVILVCLMWHHIMNSDKVRDCSISIKRLLSAKTITMVTQAVVILFLCLSIFGQSVGYKASEYRDLAIRKGLEQGASDIYLPCVPWDGIYAYGANLSEWDLYWVNIFKDYYGIPEQTTIHFIDYYDFVTNYLPGLT